MTFIKSKKAANQRLFLYSIAIPFSLLYCRHQLVTQLA